MSLLEAPLDQDLVGAITRGVRELCCDEPQHDDITVLGVLRREPA